MKMFVIEKYIMAEDIPDALKKEKKAKVDACYMDADYRRTFIDKILIQAPIPGFKPKKK